MQSQQSFAAAMLKVGDKMKLRVVGWTWYEDDFEQGERGWAARHAIIDDIKEHGYMFSGWSHQVCDGCAPILNDGKIYCYSQRGWGSIMAEAYGYTDRMDYVRFAFMIEPEEEIHPQQEFDEDEFTLEFDLNERFELEVSQDVFTAAESQCEIKLENLPELRYLDVGDTLALSCGNKSAEYAVVDVDRDRDLTEDRLLELEIAMYDIKNTKRKKRAEEEFNNAKIVMIIKLEKPTK